MRKQEQGVTMVEFAVVASTFFMMLFAVLEVGRLLFTWNTIAEITRRGARVAAVCPMNDANIKTVALFGTPGSASTSILPDLTTANINVSYLNETGGVSGTYEATRYVSVTVQNYQHQMHIPFVPADIQTLNVPPFTTTKPSESLGAQPDIGNRACYS